MSDQDRQLLDGIREMEEQAPGVGLCSYPFKVLREEIERLMRERDAALEGQEWISVDDRLPKPWTDVMVAFDDGEVWCLLQHWKNDEDERPFDYAQDAEWERWHTVTHWRPMPKAPDKER